MEEVVPIEEVIEFSWILKKIVINENVSIEKIYLKSTNQPSRLINIFRERLRNFLLLLTKKLEHRYSSNTKYYSIDFRVQTLFTEA